jgi:hypothetical protein
MNQELLDRIDLIERMVLDGRRSTQYWGWTFVLWGAGQLIALTWSIYSRRPGLAWGVTMTLCGILTAIGSARMHKEERVETAISRAVGSIWWSCGIAISILAFLGNPLGIFTVRSFLGAFFAIMGIANFANGLILHWRPQQVIGLVWFAAAGLAMVGSETVTVWTFVGMALVGEIFFGLYLMAREKADKRHAGAA